MIGERICMRTLSEEFLLRHFDLSNLNIGRLVGFILVLEIAAVGLALLALWGWCCHFVRGEKMYLVVVSVQLRGSNEVEE